MMPCKFLVSFILIKYKSKHAICFCSKIEKTNSIQSWSPNDYATAAGRSLNGKFPNAMDFMSRLDSDVSAIDFNSSCSGSNGSSCSTTGLVKIHKRERSPLSQSTSTSSTSSEVIKKKKYKLVENTFSSKLTTSSISSSTTSINDLQIFEFRKAQVLNVNNNTETAPEGRIEFLKVVSNIKQT